MCSEPEVTPRVFNPAAVPTRAIRTSASLIVTTFVAATLQLAPAYAQSGRTYVSGSGHDSSPCTLTAPCRTLQGALKLTRPGGEIQSLDSADYGYVTINQAITLSGAH